MYVSMYLYTYLSHYLIASCFTASYGFTLHYIILSCLPTLHYLVLPCLALSYLIHIICLSVGLSICPCYYVAHILYASMYLSIYLPIYLSCIYPSIHPSIRLSTYLSISVLFLRLCSGCLSLSAYAFMYLLSRNVLSQREICMCLHACTRTISMHIYIYRYVYAHMHTCSRVYTDANIDMHVIIRAPSECTCLCIYMSHVRHICSQTCSCKCTAATAFCLASCVHAARRRSVPLWQHVQPSKCGKLNQTQPLRPDVST